MQLLHLQWEAFSKDLGDILKYIFILPLSNALRAPNKTMKWNRHCPVTTCHWSFSGFTPERPVCNLQMNLPSALGRLINAFVLKQIEHSWVILSIFPEIFFYKTMFSIFVKHRTLTFPCSAGATSVTDWPASLFPLLPPAPPSDTSLLLG